MYPALIPMVTGGDVAFWICAPLMVLGALGLVFFRKAVYSALSMASVMILLAVLYASLDASFLTWVQIIVYTGAIMMMFLFVLALVGLHVPDSAVETLRGQRPLAIIFALALAVLLIVGVGGAVHQVPAGVADANNRFGGNVQGIADLLFGRYVFVFELTSALLITAAVAAMVLAHRTRVTPRLGQRARAGLRMKAYADAGEHPGPLPSSGVYAGNNSIAVPALLPDGSVSEKSVSHTLVLRGESLDPEGIAQATTDRFAEIAAAHQSEEDE